MQVAGKNRQILDLDIDFTPSIALYIWQSLKDGLSPALQTHGNIISVWLCAAEICCTQGCLGASMDHALSTLPMLLAVNPLQPFPVDRLLCVDPSSPPDALVLPPAPPLVRLLLLFAQLLTAVAAEHTTTVANSTGDVTWGEAPSELRLAIISRLQQLTEINSCVPVRLTDRVPHGIIRSPQPTGPDLVSMLRSLALFLKLATLTFSVKADFSSHAEMPVLVRSLWRVILDIAARFQVELTVTCSDGYTYTEAPVGQEEQTLCVLLFEHTVATLRQARKEPGGDVPKQGCLHLLAVVAAAMTPQLLRDEIRRLGMV